MADHRFSEKFWPDKSRGRDRRVFYGSKLEAKRDLYKELDSPNLSQRRPFYFDVLEGKPSAFTTKEARICIQIDSLVAFPGKWWTSLGFRRVLDTGGH